MGSGAFLACCWQGRGYDVDEVRSNHANDTPMLPRAQSERNAGGVFLGESLLPHLRWPEIKLPIFSTNMWAKIRLMYEMIRENGLGRLLGYAWRKFVLRSRNERPPNTVSMNLWAWSRFDWSKAGEEWTVGGEEWKASLIKHVLEPNIPIGSRVLEIGPGAGRWTEYLVKRAARFVAVDLTPKCIAICREKFKGAANAEFYVNDGRDLSFIAPGSIDRIWSFDVFVHINARDVENYVRQFAKILAPDGLAVIHHARLGDYKPGWRNDMTAEKMLSFCKTYGLEVLSQFNDWDNGRFGVYKGPQGIRPDIISVVRKAQH